MEKCGETMNTAKIKATSILGWPVWVVEVGEPIDLERPVKFISAEDRGAEFTMGEAELLLPFVRKVRPDATIVPTEKS
jgi:hypothetical protein